MKLAWREAQLPFWCWFWEHEWEWDGDFNAHLCTRCQRMDEQQQPAQEGPRIGLRLNVWWWNFLGWRLNKIHKRFSESNYLCLICRKPMRLWGRPVGNHEDCWPF